MNISACSRRSVPKTAEIVPQTREREIFRGIVFFAIALIVSSPLPVFGKGVQILMNWGGMKCPELICSLSTFSDYVYFSVLVQFFFGLALIPLASVCLHMLKPLSLGCRLTTVAFFSCATIFGLSLLLSCL